MFSRLTHLWCSDIAAERRIGLTSDSADVASVWMGSLRLANIRRNPKLPSVTNRYALRGSVVRQNFKSGLSDCTASQIEKEFSHV